MNLLLPSVFLCLLAGQVKPDNSPRAPHVELVGPESIKVGHLIRIKINNIGGELREQEITINPPIPKEDFWISPDRTELHFTAEPGSYVLEFLGIGKEVGYCRKDIKIKVQGQQPPPPVVVPQAAAPNNSNASKPRNAEPDVSTLLKQWVSSIKTTNRRTEIKVVADAAREAAQGIREKQLRPSRAVDEWASASYVAMAKDPSLNFSLWNYSGENKGEKSFFENCRDLFKRNEKFGSDANPANLLDGLADIMEDKQ